MSNKTKITTSFLGAVTIFLLNTVLSAAGIPPIDVTLSSGPGTNILTIAPGQTAVVEYKIQDVIGKPPARTWTLDPSIPSYLTRSQSINQPDCATYNQSNGNPNSFSLPQNGLCYFAFQVNGTVLAASNTKSANYKPMFSNSAGVAYGPCLSQIIQITLGTLSAPLIATGSYLDPTETQRPLLAASHDTGTTWNYSEFITDPQFINNPFFDLGALNSTSCNSNVCIAAGTYCAGSNCHPITYLPYDPDKISRPLIAVSNDSALSWSYPEGATNPVFEPNDTYPFIDEGYLTSASCNATTCIAVGSYNLTSVQRPLLALSNDSGITWQYPESITAPEFTPTDTHQFQMGQFESVSCDGNTCVAAGIYTSSGNTERPLLAISQNSGSDWIFPTSTTEPTFEPNDTYPFNFGDLHSASCSGSTCIAVGYYGSAGIIRPLLALSQDSGSNWSFPESITAPMLTSFPFDNDGEFYGASCSGNTCIAVGTYTGSNGQFHPLIALSQDSGSNWTYPNSVTDAPELTPSGQQGKLYGASCSGSICIAVGSYFIHPILALSQDSGANWSYPIAPTTMTPVFTQYPFTSGEFRSASCKGKSCLAVGSYLSGTISRPLLAESNDSGSTWTFPESITTPDLTQFPFASDGNFQATTSMSASFLPESLKFISSQTSELKNPRDRSKLSVK